MVKKKISFVSPCYNEEGNVEKFYELVKHQMETSDFEFEIVFINDGSKDNTMEKLREIYEKDNKHVKVVNFLRNFGKEAAMLAGLKEANGDYICTIDSDLQQDPIYAIQMANILENNDKVDMVAARPNNLKDPKVLAFFKKCFYIIINKMSNVPFYQGASDFRTFRKSIKDVIISLPEHNRFSKGIFSWVCPNIECIEYEVEPRNSGETKWSFMKLMKYAIGGICSFSDAPLLIPIGIGMFEFFICGIMLLAQIVGAIFGLPMNYDARWIAMLVLFVTGLQSMSTGIIAQYIMKINTEATNRPTYIVKEVLKGEDIWRD